MGNKKFIVYIHISPSNKKYVGITSRSPNQRWNNGKGYKNNEHFYNSIQKYGWNNFKHIIVAENLSKEEACELEIKLIKKFNTQDYHFGYNNTSGGEHTTFSNESKKKMSESKKGYIPSQATIEKLCIARQGHTPVPRGTKLTQEHKNKISDGLNNFYKFNKKPLQSSYHGKSVICENMIFNTMRECEKYYGLKKNTVHRWLTGYNLMPKDFYDKGLNYINTPVNFKKEIIENKKGIVFDNIFFSTIIECANYIGVDRKTVGYWLNGVYKMPSTILEKKLSYVPYYGYRANNKKGDF